MMKRQTYQALKSQLDDVVARLQDEQLDIDEALKLYQSGQRLVTELEAYLTAVKLKITKLKPE